MYFLRATFLFRDEGDSDGQHGEPGGGGFPDNFAHWLQKRHVSSTEADLHPSARFSRGSFLLPRKRKEFRHRIEELCRIRRWILEMR